MLAVCVLTRRFTGGLDSKESSPLATLSRGAFSAPSLVTRPARILPAIAWFPFVTLTRPCRLTRTPPCLIEGGQPVRQGSGPGRSTCAHRKPRRTDYLGALGKPAGGRFLVTPLFSLRENAIAKEPGSSYPE